MNSVSLIILCFFSFVQNDYVRPSFQVLIRRRNSLGVLEDGHCYGNIIQSRLVLTAASCLLSATETPNQRKLLKSEEIAVSFKDQDLNELIYFAGGFDIYPEFNVSSLDHDIAILNLSTQLPLSKRSDIQWILVADYDLKDSPLEPGVDSYAWKDSDGENVYPGYGVIHESNLVGIISYGLSSQNNNESVVENGIPNRFTPLNPYLSWIYAILQNSEIADMNNNNYSASLPYHQRKSADIVNEFSESNAESNAIEEFIDPNAEYFPEAENPIIAEIETDAEDLTSNAETHTEKLETETTAADQFNENIESEKGYYKNAANMCKANGIFTWIVLLNFIYIKYHL
ncbi:uncharacterized protein LOC108141672 [Drosophila elegans]|uniref:uncharacterized protein LOC108141672 n=1 Tax=Drosophila elegans TaxID=30023 RepID=UPI0007E6E1D1|nr:uncharacterized protein LOC108141672 [Drosophila elegans]